MTQTARVDIVSNDAGELVRREHARDLGANVVVSIYRLAKLAQLHDLGNQAFLRQLEQTHHTIDDYCLRAGTNVNVLFAHRAVFVAGQLLKGSRGTYESAAELGEILAWCGGADLTITRDVTVEHLRAFAEAISATMRSGKGTFRLAVDTIRLRPVGEAARLRGLEIEHLPFEQRVVRVYASAIVIMRRLLEDIEHGRYVLPRRVKRIAQNIVDLSEGSAAAFLGVTEMRNAASDDAGRSVNGALLAVLIARQLTRERAVLAEIAMSALMHDVGRPRALAHAKRGAGMARVRLGEDDEDRLPAGTAAVLTALGRLNEASIRRTVAVYEALWMRRPALGPVYRGARQPTVHARIIAVARRYNDLMTPDPGLPPPAPDHAIARMRAELTDPPDLAVLRMLVAALGIIPVGTVLQLSTGEVVEVVRTQGLRPVVRVVMDAAGGVVAQHVEMDLAINPNVKIARVLGTDGWTKGEGAVQDTSAPMARDPSHPSYPSRSTSGVSHVTGPTPSFGTSPSQVAQAVVTRKAVTSSSPQVSTIIETDDGRTVLAPSPFEDAERTSATAVGIVGTTPVVHILVYVLEHALTGTLELVEPNGDKHFIHFQGGAPTKVKTGRPIAPLAKELVAAGLISEPAAALAVTQAKQHNLLLGEYLVRAGQVPKERIGPILAMQMRRKLAMVVNLPPPTRYAFWQGKNLVEDWGGEGIDVEPLGTILAAVRAWHDRVRIRATLQRIASQVLVLHPESTVREIEMSPQERSVLALIEQHQVTLRDLFRARGIDEEALATLVYTLAVTRHIVLPGQRGGPMGLQPRGACIHEAPAPAQAPAPAPRPAVAHGQTQSARAPVAQAPAPSPHAPVVHTPAPIAPDVAPPPTSAPPVSQRPVPQSGLPPAASVSQPPVPQSGLPPAASVSQPPVPQSGLPPAAPDPPASQRPSPQSGPTSQRLTESLREVRMAEIALSKKDLQTAEAAARRAVQLNPDGVEASALLEWVLVMAGKKTGESAIGVLSELIALDGACVRALVARGKLLKRENKIPQAVADLEEALRLDPENKEAKNELQLLRLFARR